jgi:hypothetical protein
MTIMTGSFANGFKIITTISGPTDQELLDRAFHQAQDFQEFVELTTECGLLETLVAAVEEWGASQEVSETAFVRPKKPR